MRRFLANPKFFKAIVALLVAQSGWLALSGRYPMAFDEDFHFGIIKLYAHHLSPFWNYDPPGTAIYGAVARDPSYLYHWLMALPYRFISLFTHNQVAQIIFLRSVNIALFAVGLFIFRRLLRHTGASEPLINLSLLLFVLIPVVPLLAAQINYDNLFIPAVGLSLLLTLKFAEELKHRKRLNLKFLALLIISCLLSALVKYAFLPILLAIGFYLVWELASAYNGWRPLFKALSQGLKRLSRRTAWLLGLAVLLTAGLFVERYVVNVVRYHNPVPECSHVLSVGECRAYGPWVRDYDLAAAKKSLPPGQDKTKDTPWAYTWGDWFYGMWLRLLFSLNGPTGLFETRGPLLVPGVGAIVFGAAAIGLFTVYARRLFRLYDPAILGLLTVASLSYVAILWASEYQAYLHTGQPVAINGRYLLPVLPILLLLGGLAFQQALKQRPLLKSAAAGLAVLCLLWGGGALTFILRSNDNWLWDNGAVRHANYTLRQTIGPFVPGYRTPVQFLR